MEVGSGILQRNRELLEGACEVGFEFALQLLQVAIATGHYGNLESLSQRLELPVEVLDPFRNINVDTKKFDPDYLSEIVPEMAVAVGLAVRGV